jgi:hypothetical protein
VKCERLVGREAGTERGMWGDEWRDAASTLGRVGRGWGKCEVRSENGLLGEGLLGISRGTPLPLWGLRAFWCGSPGGVKTPWSGDCGLGRVGVYEDADGLDGWVA